MTTVAALFVEAGGCYFGVPGVDPWDEAMDARKYAGPYPVVAHPPCQRWGRYSENHPIKGKIAETGDDGGCFAHALWAVRTFGGVIEHPKDSKAFGEEFGFGLGKPMALGWTRSNDGIGWICQVEQGHYGHFARKATWLYAAHCDLPSLRWGRSEQRLPAYAIERYGYAKARRIGVMAAVGGQGQDAHPRGNAGAFPRFAHRHRPFCCEGRRMTILHLIIWFANGVCILIDWAYLLAGLFAFLRRRRHGYQPKTSHTGAPSNPPSGGSGGHRSPDAIITELRAALDSGRLDASVARINRRNETRRMQ